MSNKRRDFLKLGAAAVGTVVTEKVLAQFAPVGLYQNACASPRPPTTCVTPVNFLFSSGGNVHRSADAITWTSAPHGLPAGYSVQCTAFCNGRWFLGLLDSGGNTGAYLAHSLNGTSWTMTPNLNVGSGSRYPVNVLYFNGLYIASGGDSPGWISTSPDLVTWTARTPNISNTYMSAASCSGTAAVIGGDTLAITSSSNGTAWTARTSNLAGSITIWDIQWLNNSLFIATSSTGALSTSPDGATWTARTSGFGSVHVRSVSYGAGRYVIVGNSTYGYSSNGTSWSLGSGPAVNTSVVRFYGSKFYGAAGGTDVITSTDGINWIAEPTNISFVLAGPYNFAVRS